ncbi:MAG: DUF4345 family protein [Spongiibacteraceae bacterium]
MKTRLFTGLMGMGVLAAGLLYLIDIHYALSLTGNISADASAVVDLRATYAGLQIGLAGFLITAVIRGDNLIAPLSIVAWTLASVGSIRLFGYLTNAHIPALQLYASVFELTTAIIAIALVFQAQKDNASAG